MTPQETLRRALLNDEFPEDVAADRLFTPSGEDALRLNRNIALSAWMSQVSGQDINAGSATWQQDKDALVQGYFKNPTASNVSDEQLHSIVKTHIQTAEEAADIAANIALQGKPSSEALKMLNAKRGPSLVRGVWDRYTKDALNRHFALASKLSPYRGIIDSAASQLGSEMEWSVPTTQKFQEVAKTLLEVPEADRQLVISAIGATGGATPEERSSYLSKLAGAMGRLTETVGSSTVGALEQIGTTFEQLGQVPEAIASALSGGVTMQGELAASKARSEEMLKTKEDQVAFQILTQQIRQVADSEISPIKGDGWWSQTGIDVARMIPQVAVTVASPTLGTAANLAYFKNTVAAEAKSEDPSLTYEQADAVGSLTSPFNATIETATALIPFGRVKVPLLTKWLSTATTSLSGAARNIVLRSAAVTVSELGEEMAQAIAPLWTQEALSALQKDMPGVDWERRMPDFSKIAAQTWGPALAFGLVAGGAASISEVSSGRSLTSDRDKLIEFGVSPVKADEIAAASVAGDWAKTDALIREDGIFTTATPEEMKEAAAANRDEEQRHVAIEEELKRRGELPDVMINPQTGKYRVIDREGNILIETDKRADALNVAYSTLEENQRIAAEATVQIFDELMATRGTQAEGAVVSQRRQTAQTLVDEGIVSYDQMMQGAMTAAKADGVSEQQAQIDSSTINGFSRAEYWDQVRTMVSRTFATGGVETAIHETVHNRVRRGMANGTYTREMALEWVRAAERALEGKTDKAGKPIKFLPSENDAEIDDRVLEEAVAELAVADTIGRRKSGTRFTPGLIAQGISARLRAEKNAFLGKTKEERAAARKAAETEPPAPAATYNSEEAYQKARAEALRNFQQSQQPPAAERNTDLFPDRTDFMGKLQQEAQLSSYEDQGDFGIAEYVNPDTGTVDVYVAAFGDTDYIAYIRQYDEAGKPTNTFTSKLERRSDAPGVTKKMLQSLQSRLPAQHQYTEDVSVSTDGLRFIASQLNQGYELARDAQGNPLTRDIAVSGESRVNDLPVAVDPNGAFENIRISDRKQFEAVRPVLGKILSRFGPEFGPQNVRWENGTVFIDIPVLQKKGLPVGAPVVEVPETLDQQTEPTGEQKARGNLARFKLFLQGWKETLGNMLRIARQVQDARQEGKLGEDFDAFLDNLLGTDAQSRYDLQTQQEAKQLLEDGKMPFSMNRKGGDLREYSVDAFHGTNSRKFNQFDILNLGKGSGNEGLFSAGFYFSPSSDDAKGYGKNLVSVGLKVKNPLIVPDSFPVMMRGDDSAEYWASFDAQMKSALKSVFSANNFNEVDRVDAVQMDESFVGSFSRAYKALSGVSLPPSKAAEVSANLIQRAGFDAVYAKDGDTTTEIVVYDPSNILVKEWNGKPVESPMFSMGKPSVKTAIEVDGKIHTTAGSHYDATLDYIVRQMPAYQREDMEAAREKAGEILTNEWLKEHGVKQGFVVDGEFMTREETLAKVKELGIPTPLADEEQRNWFDSQDIQEMGPMFSMTPQVNEVQYFDTSWLPIDYKLRVGEWTALDLDRGVESGSFETRQEAENRVKQIEERGRKAESFFSPNTFRIVGNGPYLSSGAWNSEEAAKKYFLIANNLEEIKIWRAPDTTTKKFKHAFGESKIVDAAGKPLLVRHGTRDFGFSKFKLRDETDGDYGVRLISFTANAELAESYARSGSVLDANNKGVINSKKPGIYEAYLRIERPLDLAKKLGDYSSAEIEAILKAGGVKEFQVSRDTLVGDVLRFEDGAHSMNMGAITSMFDGIIDKDYYNSFFVFSPDQVILSSRAESSRAESSQDIRFSSRSMASVLEAALEAQRRNPEFRERLLRLAVEKAQAIRQDGPMRVNKRGVVSQRKGTDTMAENDRTKANIEAERKFRLRSRQRELIDAGMAQLTPETLAAYDQGLTTLEDNPLINSMLNDHGKLMSKTAAEKAGKLKTDGKGNAGDYDDAPRLPIAWYSKSGGIMPDVMAENLGFDSVPAFWEALRSAIYSTRTANESFKKARAAVRQVEVDALAQATKEANEWAAEAEAKVPTPKEKQLAALRTLDAILSIFPPEISGKVGGMYQLAKANTDAAREKEILKRVEIIDKVLEKEGVKLYRAKIEKLFKRYAPKKEAGKKPVGQLDPDAQELVDAASEAMDYDEVRMRAEVSAIDSMLAEEGLSDERETYLERKRELIQLFADYKNADAARLESAADALEATASEGWAKWKLKKIMERERREEARKSLVADTGKPSIGKERDKQNKWAKTTFGKPFSMLLNISSFSELLRFEFGEKSAESRRLEDQERAAAYAYEDAMQSFGDRIGDFFAELAGGRLAGEQLRFDLAQPTLTVGTGDNERTISQLQGIQALLMWQQEDGRRHMEGQLDESGKPVGSWHYGEEWVKDLEGKMTPEAYQVKAFLEQLYSEEYPALNALYRQRHGVNLPKNPLYSPLTVQPMQAKAGEMVDPVSGFAVTGSILTPGGLRTRNKRAVAEPRFEDAVQIFLGHSRQMEHWKAYYDFAMDAQAILLNREVTNAVESKGSKQAVAVLKKWVDQFAQGGSRDAQAGLEISNFYSRASGRAARVALLGRISTILIQSTQLAAASVKMPLGAYLKRLGMLLSGNLNYADAVKSPFIQRRYKTAPPIVQQANAGVGDANRPGALSSTTPRILGNALSGADALFTGGTYAMLLDYHRTVTGPALGLQGVELESFAQKEAERDTEAVAQPVRAGTRSIFENTLTSPLAKTGFAFASEARQKIALAAWAAYKAKSDPTQAAKVAFLTFIVGGLVTQVIKNLWREAKGDDDEKMWSAERLTKATLAGPLHGIPGVSELMGDPGLFSGFKWSAGAVEKIATKAMEDDLDEVTMRDMENALSAAGYFNDTAAGIAGLSHLGFDFAKILQALAEEE